MQFLLWGMLLSIALAVPRLETIRPNRFEKNFGNEIDVHTMNVSLASPSNQSIMLFAGPLYEPFDRTPPDSSWKYCEGKEGMVVKDHSRIEEYVYTCCVQRSTIEFACPVPPAPLPDIFRALPRTDTYTVYAKFVSTQGTWQKTNQVLEYYDRNDVVGFVKRSIACIVLACIALGGIIHIMGAVNTFSNKFPIVFLYLHIVTTIFLVLVEWTMVHYMEPSYIRAGLAHSLFHAILSPFVVYVPGTVKGRDQRISISPHSSYLTDILEISKHPHTRYAIFLFYTASMSIQGLSVYALVHVMWETFDASFEVIVGVVLGYMIVTLVYFVAFITGLYNIHIPLRIGHDVEANHSQTATPRITFAGVQKVGMYQSSTRMFVPVSRLTFKEGDCIAIDNGNHKLFSLVCWKMRINTNIYRAWGQRVEIPRRKDKGDLFVYTVNAQGDLERIGVIRNNQVFHHEHAILLRAFQWLLRMAPVYDDSDGNYQLNIIELLRDQMQRLTKQYTIRNQSVYGIMYWSMFVATITGTIWWLGQNIVQHALHDTLWVYVLDLITTAVLIVFVINVATRKDHVPMSSSTRGKKKPRAVVCSGTHSFVVEEETVHIHVKEGFVSTIRSNNTNVSPTCLHRHPMHCRIVTHDRYLCDAPECESPRQVVNASVWFCEQCNFCICTTCAKSIVATRGDRIHVQGECVLQVSF